MSEKNPHAVALGALGGRAGRGAAKARPSDVARAAVMHRWRKKAGGSIGPAKPGGTVRSKPPTSPP